MGRFTEDELQIAKSVDLVNLAADVHIPLKKVGSVFSIEGMDSAIIFNRSSWYRYSRGVGGSTIDFLMYFKDMEYKEAVSYLLNFAGYIRSEIPSHHTEKKMKADTTDRKPKEKEKVPFALPEKAGTCRGLYAYLMKRRKLSSRIINHWLKHDLMYESVPYHNIVFLGKRADGKVMFASQRGIRDFYGKPFKGDVAGNDKTYGVNLINPQSTELCVYEAAIDAMSDMDFRSDYETSILALGMVSDGPLQTILQEHPEIKTLDFCLDNDIPGRAAAKKLGRKYVLEGYEVYLRLPPFGKDHNFFLQCERENRALWKKASRIHSPHGRNLRETEHRKNRGEEISHVSQSIAKSMYGVVDMCNKKQRYVASR